jgi:hypothetical protein
MIATGTDSLENGAVGEAARGYRMLDENQLWPPPREVAFLHSDDLRTTDPAFRAAIGDVVRRIGTDGVDVADPRFSRDGHCDRRTKRSSGRCGRPDGR